uniref:Uncharacterized protein n=1 Tax=Utricularia reniformis TaxID=192314 RepID=A0A1Y0B2B4_9LAMI|nr:hypothetical protein AEK19_MT1333 [Utricularia reniformis]ART31531.1 hypothetical protein AEK19_MT1333 [Utricularia reniformis]
MGLVSALTSLTSRKAPNTLFLFYVLCHRRVRKGKEASILLYPVFSQPMISEQVSSQTRKPAIPKPLKAVPESRV